VPFELGSGQIQDFIQVLVNGLAMGAIYALIAVSFVLVYKAVGIVNFAAGELVVLGGYIGVVLANELHIPIWIALAGTIVLMSVFGYIFMLVAYQPLRGQPFLVVAISTLAFGIIITNGIQWAFGAAPRKLETLLDVPTVTIGGIHLVVQHLVIVVVTVVTLVSINYLFARTSLGHRMMATAQDTEVSRLLGINVDRMVAITFVLSCALAGIAGFLLAPIFYLVPTMGLGLALKGFAAAIIGGFGEVRGSIIGGIGIGVTEILLARYVSSSYRDLLIFAIVLAFLFFRSEGVLSSRIGQKV
jgi:branched-chain amino acid transport system permease protein